MAAIRPQLFTKPGTRHAHSAAGHRADHDEGLVPCEDEVRQWSVGRSVREVLFAGEEAYERAALLRTDVAHGAPQHRVLGLERVEDRLLRRLTVEVDFDLSVDLGERAQVRGEP